MTINAQRFELHVWEAETTSIFQINEIEWTFGISLHHGEHLLIPSDQGSAAHLFQPLPWVQLCLFSNTCCWRPSRLVIHWCKLFKLQSFGFLLQSFGDFEGSRTTSYCIYFLRTVYVSCRSPESSSIAKGTALASSTAKARAKFNTPQDHHGPPATTLQPALGGEKTIHSFS